MCGQAHSARYETLQRKGIPALMAYCLRWTLTATRKIAELDFVLLYYARSTCSANARHEALQRGAPDSYHALRVPKLCFQHSPPGTYHVQQRQTRTTSSYLKVCHKLHRNTPKGRGKQLARPAPTSGYNVRTTYSR